MSEAASATRKYDLYSHETKSDPYPIFAAMQRDDPLFCQPGIDGKTMIWFATRYGDVETILRDERHFVRDERNAIPPEQVYHPSPLEEMLFNHMLNRDGDEHTRLRNLVGKAFTPRRIRDLRPRIQEIADELLDNLLPQGVMDLVADYAYHLPTIVIAELLGIPAEDRPKFKAWSNHFVSPTVSEGEQAQFARAMQEFVAYLGGIFELRREYPQDDLISALLQAEVAGDQLSEQEIYSTVILLVVAGHETTVSLIGNAVLALFRHPPTMQRLVNDPSLVEGAIDELLRYDGPVERALNRWVSEDVELAGQQLKKGDLVIGIIAAANHDSQRFANPHELDLDRPPARHLAFGQGAHYCLGAPLARLETEIALGTLLRRLPGIHPSAPLDGLDWRLVPMFRSLASLPVEW